jgi:phage terminase small subunit
LRQNGEILFGGKRRVFEARPHFLDRAAKHSWRKVQMIAQELVRMLGFDPERL